MAARRPCAASLLGSMVGANRAALTADGYELDEVAYALNDENARYELWPDFEQVIIRDFSAAFPLDPSTWRIGTAPRVLAPHLELLYVHRDIPEGGFLAGWRQRRGCASSTAPW
jgi:hypothetical protein